MADVSSAPIILGIDFIKNHNVLINFNNSTITIGTNTVPFRIQTEKLNHGYSLKADYANADLVCKR